MNDLTGQTVELLQTLIRNRCVNDGTDASGNETRNADVLRQFLGGTGLELQQFGPTPQRQSLVARIEGTDPTAPSLCLMGHTARPVRWRAGRWPVRPRGVGPWRRRHAQPHIVDGRRVSSSRHHRLSTQG